MPNLKRLLLFTALCAIILCACGRKNTSTAPSVVTQIDIFCEQNGKEFSIQYTDNEKIEAVLLYLRLLNKSRIPAYAPPVEEHSLFQIRLHYLGGNTRLYKQVDHRYIWQDNTGWSKIPAEQAAQLYSLLQHYPSDL